MDDDRDADPDSECDEAWQGKYLGSCITAIVKQTSLYALTIIRHHGIVGKAGTACSCGTAITPTGTQDASDA